MGNLRVINIGQLVTPSGRGSLTGVDMSRLRILEDGEILIRDGRIAAIEKAASRKSGDEIVDARGGVVLPGLIDPHTHIVSPLDSHRVDEDPAEGVARHERYPGVASSEVCEMRLVRALRQALAGGTTTLETKCEPAPGGESQGGELRSLRNASRVTPIRVLSTLLGSLSAAAGRSRDDCISSLIREDIPTVRRKRLAQFCDVVCGEGGYTQDEARTILRAGRGAGLRPKVHLGGRPAKGGIALSVELEVTSVDHVVGPSPSEMAMLQRTGTVSVLLPCAAYLTNGRFPDAREMIAAGVAVALGTDHGLEGYGMGSMWFALLLAVIKMGMSVEEAICACTLNAAAALEMADEVGSLEIGKRADLVILDLDDYRETARGCVQGAVATVIVDGSVGFQAKTWN